MAPYKFISRISRGDQIDQYGDGSTSRDYTFIDDIVDGVVRAIDRPYPYQIFNLGKGSGTKLGDFIRLVEDAVGKKANIKLMPPQPGDVPFTNADVSKARRLLGYESRCTIEEGVRRTVAWYKEAFGEDGSGGGPSGSKMKSDGGQNEPAEQNGKKAEAKSGNPDAEEKKVEATNGNSSVQREEEDEGAKNASSAAQKNEEEANDAS